MIRVLIDNRAEAINIATRLQDENFCKEFYILEKSQSNGSVFLFANVYSGKMSQAISMLKKNQNILECKIIRKESTKWTNELFPPHKTFHGTDIPKD